MVGATDSLLSVNMDLDIRHGLRHAATTLMPMARADGIRDTVVSLLKVPCFNQKATIRDARDMDLDDKGNVGSLIAVSMRLPMHHVEKNRALCTRRHEQHESRIIRAASKGAA